MTLNEFIDELTRHRNSFGGDDDIVMPNGTTPGIGLIQHYDADEREVFQYHSLSEVTPVDQHFRIREDGTFEILNPREAAMTYLEEKIEDALKEFKIRRESGALPSSCEFLKEPCDDGLLTAGYPRLLSYPRGELRDVMFDFIGTVSEDLDDWDLEKVAALFADENFMRELR